MHNVKRPLTLFLGAAGASMSSYLYMGDDASAPHTSASATTTTTAIVPAAPSSSSSSSPSKTRSKRSHKHTPKALSQKELGLDQSLARDFACWISSASVYAARQAFYASARRQQSKQQQLPSNNASATNAANATIATAAKLILAPDNPAANDPNKDDDSKASTLTGGSNVYHNLFGWLQELTPAAQWDPEQVIQSSSFTMLLNLVSSSSASSGSPGAGLGSQLAMREELEQELFRAVGVLATNAQCAREIAERATRYGKLALLHLAEAHEDDPRVGAALHKLVVLDDAAGCSFGPANLVSLMSLAVAADIPDEYLEFALWAMSKAASPHSVARKYEWRKTLFGDDATAKTKRKLLSNDTLWLALLEIADQRSEVVQLQAARLLNELSDDALIGDKMRKHDRSAEVLMQWMVSSNVPLVCTALEIVAKVAQQDEQLRAMLLDMGMLDVLRMRILENNRDCRMTAKLLHAVHCIAEPLTTAGGTTVFALDQDALSFVNDDDDADEDLIGHHDEFVAPRSVAKQSQYVDGWIELFTAFLKSDDERVRVQAASCLQQIAEKGAHSNQSKQEWLIAILDAVLNQVPLEIARASTSVREAKSRTRPIAGYETEGAKYEAAHAKALRALAFVLGRKECQQELVRLGGLDLLKLLMKSENSSVQRETARVLANLFSCDDIHDGVLAFALGDEQLTEVLETWTRSKDIQLQSLAHRARSNRRFQSTASSSKGTTKVKANDKRRRRTDVEAEADGVKYLDGVHPLHFSSTPDEFSLNNANDSNTGSRQSSDQQYDVDVVFIHGLLGCPYETWMCGEDESTVWAHEWLLDDLKREGRNPRVLSIGYDSQLLSSASAWRTMGFQCTSEEITQKLDAARVGGSPGSDRPVIFVTHSLGGVLLKQVLHDSAAANNSEGEEESSSSRLVDNVAGVMFYGVPHHGSPVAQTIRAFRPRSLGIDQHPVTEHLHGTPHTEMLNDWCASLFEERGIAALSIGETLPCRLPVVGFETLVVPPESANPGFGEFVSVANSTHMSVCKPSSQQDVRYKLAHEFISKHAAAKAPRAAGVSEEELMTGLDDVE